MNYEFKGTKGKFKNGYKGWRPFQYPPDCAVGFSTHEIHYSDDGECVAELVHGSANALLLSKAPEMFEMLKDILEANENGENYHSYKIEQLLKEATEL